MKNEEKEKFMKRDLSRLAELVDVVLPQVKDEEFDLEVWKGEGACGTVACAVGHACSHLPFQKAGLTLSYWFPKGYTPYPRFEGKTGIEAIKDFFNLTEKEVHYLFLPHSYKCVIGGCAKEVVMERIREFLSTNSSSES